MSEWSLLLVWRTDERRWIMKSKHVCCCVTESPNAWLDILNKPTLCHRSSFTCVFCLKLIMCLASEGQWLLRSRNQRSYCFQHQTRRAANVSVAHQWHAVMNTHTREDTHIHTHTKTQTHTHTHTHTRRHTHTHTHTMNNHLWICASSHWGLRSCWYSVWTHSALREWNHRDWWEIRL